MTIGPLRYLFIGHDDIAGRWLSRLQRNLVCTPFTEAPDRIVHLLQQKPSQKLIDKIATGFLPERLAPFIPDDCPGAGWNPSIDETGQTTLQHDSTRHSFILLGIIRSRFRTRFRFPWQLVINDIMQRQGCLIHGGLAAVEGRGCLFTAPPGGGKTTALGRISVPWRVVADDAALVWPDGTGGFLASPLPTWSVHLGLNAPLPVLRQVNVDLCVSVGGIIFLQKGVREEIERCRPVEAATHLYRALSEHPRMVATRHAIKEELFRTACRLARTVTFWQLTLTIDGPFWEKLDEAGLP